MGLFSWDCKSCGHPALSHSATDKGINDWMAQIVVLFANGDQMSGEYDGYGRAGQWDYSESVGNCEPCLYHRACWEVAGKPGFTTPSRHSHDQGWFFADGDHDMLDPRETHAPGTLENLAAKRDGWKRGTAFLEADNKADRGTYEALWHLKLDRARGMSLPEREAEFGFDILKYADLPYEDVF